jgi:AAHS family 3-hydroxyphenylpropionic acid transporter
MSRTEPAAGGVQTTSLITVLLCYFVGIFEGFDLQAAGVAAPKLGPVFHMTPGQLAWFFSASTFGLMVGAAIGGRLSDRFGRKRVLIAAIAAFGLMSVANALAPNVEALLITRFLTGVGLGGALPNLVALVAENTAPATRNTWVGSLYAGLPTGGALVSLVSLLGGASDWHIVFYIGGLAPLLAVPLLIFFLPESRALQAVRAAGSAAADKVGFVTALFSEGRTGRTLCLWAGFFLSLLTMYVLLNWLPTLLVSRGLTRPQAALVQVSFNVFSAFASVGTGMFMDRAPLRTVVATSFVCAALGLVLLWLAPAVIGVSLIVGGVVGATMSMTQALLYALAPTTYPTSVRGTGVGSAVAVGRLGSALGPLLAGALLGSGNPPQVVLMVLIPIIIVAGIGAFAVAMLMGPAGRLRPSEAAAAH